LEPAVGVVLIEHVSLSDLPESWRARVNAPEGVKLTVRIEQEASAPASDAVQVGDNLLFGMWRDRADMADVETYVRALRAPRFQGDASSTDSGQS
jgi:hypothetical protein